MLGMIFTNLVEMIETEVSLEIADAILSEAELSTAGAYTAVGDYPFSDILTIVTSLSKKTNTPVNELIFSFGEYLFGKLIAAHKNMISVHASLIDVLAQLDSNIHVEVKKLYPNATLPSFTVLEKTVDSISLVYQSPRQLDTLAVGLISGGAKHFGIEVDMIRTAISTDPYKVKIDVKILEPA